MIILLLLLLLIPAPAGSPNLESSVTDEEYAVCSALINSTFLHPKTDLAIIQAYTEFDRSVDIPEEFKADLLLKIQRSETIERRFDLRVKYVLLDQAKIETLFQKDLGKGWERYWRQYPNATGLLAFSRVGFDRAHNKAYVYARETCGALCG